MSGTKKETSGNEEAGKLLCSADDLARTSPAPNTTINERHYRRKNRCILLLRAHVWEGFHAYMMTALWIFQMGQYSHHLTPGRRVFPEMASQRVGFAQENGQTACLSEAGSIWCLAIFKRSVQGQKIFVLCCPLLPLLSPCCWGRRRCSHGLEVAG